MTLEAPCQVPLAKVWLALRISKPRDMLHRLNSDGVCNYCGPQGIRISPRTVRRYMPKDRGPRRGPSSQRWMTFVRNHTKGILACDSS